MKREKVRSSNIAAIGYSERTQTLEVAFLAEGDKQRAEVRKEEGAIYRYMGVPPQVHDALMKAESKGKYFHANIRDRYPFDKVRAEPKPKKKKGAK